MIAFDKLLKNLDYYKQMYAQMGCDYDLDVFVQLEAERKATQLECEAARAECNKLCAKMPKLREAGADTSELMSQILSLDKKANQLKQQLEAQSNDIDERLKHLRNIPAPFVAKDEPLVVNGTLATAGAVLCSTLDNHTTGNITNTNIPTTVNTVSNSTTDNSSTSQPSTDNVTTSDPTAANSTAGNTVANSTASNTGAAPEVTGEAPDNNGEPLVVNGTLATASGTTGNPTTCDGKFSLDELKLFFKSKYSCFECNFSIKSDLKSKNNRLFLEEELPEVDFCTDAISVFCTDYEARAEFEKIKSVLLNHALFACRLSSLKLDFSASEAFEFKFLNGEVQLQFVGDFCARDFSIKYKNKAQDSTKFVSQIVLKILDIS